MILQLPTPPPPDPIVRAVESIASAHPELLATMPRDELRERVAEFAAALANVARQRTQEVL